MNLIGESFDDYVATQVNLRQRFYGSSTTPLEGREQYLYNKQPFVKLVSSVDITADKLKTLGLPETLAGDGLAKTFVLFAGTSEFQGLTNEGRDTFNLRAGLNTNQATLGNSAYGLGGLEFGQVPMPGITSATVSYKNRGSLKTASINIKAYNRTQLNIIDALYLRLGYTVLLEWGWGANFLSNSGNVVPQIRRTLTNGFLDGSLNSGNILTTIRQSRENVSANYDALYGRITNFNWSFNPDGTYDITVSLVSVGDIIESLTVNDILGKGITTTSDEFQSVIDNVKDQLKNLGTTATSISINGKQAEVTSEYFGSSGTSRYIKDKSGAILALKTSTTFQADDEVILALITRTTGLVSQTPVTGSNASIVATNAGLNSLTYFLYKDIQLELDSSTAISFTPKISVLKQGSTTYACKINWGENSSEPNYYIKLRTLLRWIQNNLIYDNVNGDKKTKAITFDLDPSDNLIYKNKYSVATDYTKVITRNMSYPNFNTPESSDTINLLDLPEDTIFTSDKNPNAGKLMNMFLNLTWLVETLKSNIDNEGNISLFSFLQGICQGINSSLGYVNSLDVVVEEETNTIKFIDDKPIPGINLKDFELNDTPTEFQVYAFSPSGSNLNGSFVRDFGIRTDVTNKLATTLAIGAQAVNAVVTENATALQSWNEGLTDRTAKTKKLAVEESTERTAWDRYGDDVDNYISLLKKYSSKTLSKEELDQFNNLNKNWQKFWSQTIAELEKKASPTGVGFIPINLNLTMDGLSGMKIYQTFTVNSKFLPLNYPDKLQFLIKGISHNITKNSWTTEIESFSIPKDITSKNLPSPPSIPDTSQAEEEISRRNESSGTVPFIYPVYNGVIRGQDAAGSGKYGASRGGGTRSHLGIDLITPADRTITLYAPISGKITFGAPYGKARLTTSGWNVDQGFTIYGQGGTEYEGYVVQAFYNVLNVKAGTIVNIGDPVAYTIYDMYSAYSKTEGKNGMTNHVHYQVKYKGKPIDPSFLVKGDNTLYKLVNDPNTKILSPAEKKRLADLAKKNR